MPKRISAADRHAHTGRGRDHGQSPGRRAALRAQTALRRELPGLELVVHAADEWGSDADGAGRCLADIARGDIVVATMLFLDDHIRAVLPALTARRDHCDAMVCCLSAGEVVRLTRLGKFNMTGEATGALAC